MVVLARGRQQVEGWSHDHDQLNRGHGMLSRLLEQREFLKGEMSYRRRCHWDCPHDLFFVPFHSWLVGAY